jgi:hypothetical protein
MASSSATISSMAAALGSPPAQLLTRENALVWKALVVPALRGARALNLVEGKDPAPPETIEVTTNGKSEQIDNPAYDTWIARDQQVLRFLLNCLSPDMLSHGLGLDTSAAVWKTINSLTTTQSKARA